MIKDIRKYLFSEKLNKGKKYFKEKISYPFNQLKAHPVPENIKRPNYVLDKNFDYEKKEYAIHKTEEDIKNHRLSCKITAKVLQKIEEASEKDMFNTTEDIDKFVHNLIIKENAYPTAIGFMGFPKSLCTSTNEVVVHGIPNTRLLQEGDSINTDVTSFYNGFHGDSSVMIYKNKNKVDKEILKLSEVTRNSMFKAISYCKPGESISTIGKVIEEYIGNFGYAVVKEFSGHGVGKNVHMNPSILHFDISKYDKNYSEYYKNEKMVPGMTFTIEPVICMKEYDNIYCLPDNWTIMLPEDNPSAQWEHIILITKDGYEILTLRENEFIPLNL